MNRDEMPVQVFVGTSSPIRSQSAVDLPAIKSCSFAREPDVRNPASRRTT